MSNTGDKVVIGIWEDGDGIYYRCNNCNHISEHYKDLKVVLAMSRVHYKACPQLRRWSNMTQDGKKLTLIGFEVTFL